MAILSEKDSLSAEKIENFAAAAEKRGQIAAVFIDFDGTICPNDITDMLLSRFAPPLWEKVEADWLAGRIGARECLSKQIALMKAAPAALERALDTVAIDAGFPAFVELLRRDLVPAAIVSDGLDYSIHHILRAHRLGDLAVYSNHLVYCGDESWRLEFPYRQQNCPAGHCKCRRFDAVAADGLTVYIGDGASDFCPAQKADIIFAKDKLADFCKKQRINHIEIDNFTDILALWPQLPQYHAGSARAARELAAS